MTSSTVNVVTVTHNSEDTIGTLLRSLARQRDCIHAVTIVDSGSTDATVPTARGLAASLDMQVEVLPGRNSGFAGGYARAATEAQLLDNRLDTLCVNPDVELSDGTVAALIQALAADPLVAIATAPLVRADGTPDNASVRALPRFGASAVYAALGRLTPKTFRYNERRIELNGSGKALEIEATTGALMLVSASWRPPRDGIFNVAYWMYGEDLELCADAQRDGLRVVILDISPSIHLKGASSGIPRSWKSNRAFHDALYIYYKRNLAVGPPVLNPVVKALVLARLVFSHGHSAASRALRGVRTAERGEKPRTRPDKTD